MKKLMKAIAFATVMCMLLSTAAFASTATMTDATTVNVEITGATENTPIAFVVTDTTVTSAANITSGNIKYIDQTTTDANGGVTVNLNTGGLETVNVFYGYQGVGDEAKMLSAALEVAVNETVVVTFVEFIDDDTIQAAADEEGSTIPETDNDKAGAVIAKVNVTKAEGKTISDMIWSFRYKTSEEADTEYAYVKADSSLFNVLNGDVQIGLAFSNGNESGLAEVLVTDLEAIVKLVDAENNANVIFSDPTDAERENTEK